MIQVFFKYMSDFFGLHFTKLKNPDIKNYPLKISNVTEELPGLEI
jgi:hypothetical protein